MNVYVPAVIYMLYKQVCQSQFVPEMPGKYGVTQFAEQKTDLHNPKFKSRSARSHKRTKNESARTGLIKLNNQIKV